jgi:hypothetical protein|tara:strand:- start:272 stop:502 length:231 start_codon:yes stop_codon:yes gene_type:complete
MTKQELIAKAIAYTAARYNMGHGWELFTECYGASEWDAFMSANDYSPELTTWKAVVESLHTLADIKNEQYDECQDY